MRRTISSVKERAASPTGQKAIKYTLVSVISVAVSQTVFIVAFGGMHWTAKSSAVLATSIGAVPSYYLNRNWAWGKSGRSHMWREVVPFWVIAFIGLAFSTWSSDLAETYVDRHTMSHLAKTVLVTGAFFGAFAVLWVAKFVIFNKILFTHDEDLNAALANEVVA
ncbi:MAG TPA: GtrA family protein [Acidimicrobiales bacterium]|jgi:putative flippase GtrA|nr:GtrA family protein [Acidimicrobiales bacterium]